MNKNAFTSSKTWLYVILITTGVLKKDATNDYPPGISDEMTRSAGLLVHSSDTPTMGTVTTTPIMNNYPAGGIRSGTSSSAMVVPSSIPMDVVDKDGNQASASILFPDDHYRLERLHGSTNEEMRGATQHDDDDDATPASPRASPPTKSEPAALSKHEPNLASHPSPPALQDFVVDKNIPKSRHEVGASTKCPADIVLMTHDVTHWLARSPITIISQDDNTVTFTISDPFGTDSLLDTTTTIFYRYAAAQTGATKCEALSPTTSPSSSSHLVQPVEITAHCMKSPSRQSSLTIVDVWLVDPSTRQTATVNFDHQDFVPLPNNCFKNMHSKKAQQLQQQHDGSVLPNGSLSLYSYKIFCQPQCNPTDAIVLDESVVAYNHGLARDTRTASLMVLGEENDLLKPSKDEKEKVLSCDASDYPCGSDGTMVKVCHYSTKDGYRTHCISQSDSSSLIGYFWKDYCGPCAVEGEGTWSS